MIDGFADMTASTEFEERGYFVSAALLDQSDCDTLGERVELLQLATAGTRNLLDLHWCFDLASRLHQHPGLVELLPAPHVPVQCALFEKSADRNWLVAIHQDLSIPVRERIEHPELNGWAEKEGALYVQAPQHILEEMIIVRLHLDPCGPQDGPLRVVPGSHRLGRLNNEQSIAQRAHRGEQACCVARGAVLVMRPLLLHASPKATGSSRRRVLHFVYGPPSLPHGLRWDRAA